MATTLQWLSSSWWTVQKSPPLKRHQPLS